ncbi:MAG: cytochrome ubiquinol oxidase subunit I [Methanotrichaceae archaeon]
MIKLTTLVLVLTAFFFVLTLYIAPQQGALISTTAIDLNELDTVKPQYSENLLPAQTVGLGSQGRSIFMAVVLTGHTQLANLALGGSWILVITEFLFLRFKRERYRNLARSMAFFSVIFFSIGATFGASALLFVYSLYPVLTLNLFHIYWWPIFANLLLWSTQIFFLWLYFYTWNRIKTSSHIFVGLGYAIASFFQAMAIQMMGSGMLTPNHTEIAWGYMDILTMDYRTLLSWWFNPTLLNLQFHRLAGAISYFGFLIAVLAMFHYQDKKDKPNAQKYWDWVGSYGLAWGLAGLAVQPILGVLYMRQIMSASPEAFEMIMHGPRAWEMLWMVGLLSALSLTSIVYFIDRREAILSNVESRNIVRILKILLVIAAISAFILVNPGWLGATFRSDPSAWINPLGKMAYKYIALALLSITTLIVVAIDIITLGDAREKDWGNLPRSSRASGIFAGMLGMWVVMAMGFVRESARSPWTIWKIIPVHEGTIYPTPISLWSIFIIWGALLALLLTVFWYVSKVTAEVTVKHPEDSEKD